MGFFKKTEYVDEVIPEIAGTKDAMVVTIRNMPCRREVGTSKLKFRYAEVSTDMLDELVGRHRVTYEDVKQLSDRGEKFAATFHLRHLPELEMSVEIRGNIPSKKTFESDLLDAIMDAWEKNNIKR